MTTAEPAKPSLRQRSLRAAAIGLSGHVGQQVLRLGSNLVMTRLLVPEMFGVMALGFIMLALISLFSDVGLHQSIVQNRRGAEPRFLNTAWTLQILQGMLIGSFMAVAGVGVITANLYGLFPVDSAYAHPDLPYVIFAFAGIAVLDGCKSTKLAMAQRNLHQGRQTLIALSAQMLSMFVMVMIALQWPTIWALVIGAIVTAVARTSLSHVALPGHPNRLCWDKPFVREIFGFGKWIFLSSGIGFLSQSADKWILGFVLTPAAFGTFAIASVIMEAFFGLFGRVTNTVSLPALSEVNRGDPGRVRSVYLKIRRPIDAFALLLAGFLMVTGQFWIDVLYDDRYLLAGEMLQILAVKVMTWQFVVATDAFLAIGRPKYLTLVSITRLLSIIVFVTAGILFWGEDYVLWAIVLSSFGVLPLIFYLKRRLGLLSLRFELLSTLVFPVGWLLGKGMMEIVYWLELDKLV